MSIAVVTTILSNAKTLIAANLSAWSQLLYEHDLEKNPNGRKTKRFGFIAGSATTIGSTIGSTAFNHNFQLILMDTYMSKDSDSQINTKVSAIMDYGHDVIKVLGSDRLGQLLVEPIDIEAPEYFDDESRSAVAVKFNVLVKYRYRNT